jgi:mycoredoxin
MSNQGITIYGTCWCGDCFRARKFLDKHGIVYRWVNIDQDNDGERIVLRINKGMRSVPTIIFDDGSMLVEPTNLELLKKLGLVHSV